MMVASYDLDERGYFWWRDEPIPDGDFAPSRGFYGHLTVSNIGDVSLDLDGRLSADQNPLKLPSQSGQEVKRQISGILRNSNRSVLLSDVWTDGGRMSANGLSHEQYTADLCLVSASPFANTTELPRHGRMTIPLDGFEQWLALGAIKAERSNSHLTLQHERQVNYSYILNDGTLEINHDLNGPRMGTVWTDRISLKEVATLVYSFQTLVSTEEIIEKYRWIEDLLILLSNVERTLEWPTAQTGPESASVTLYFRRITRLTKEVQWHNCWTSFPRLKEHFGSILNNWNLKRDLIGPGFYLYLGTRRGMDLYTEHKFTSLAFGLESFHRTLNPETKNVKLDAKITRIINQVAGPKDKKWLKSRLRNMAGPNLQERLVEILRPLPIGLNEINLQAFANRCAKFRNDISHHGEIQGPGAYHRNITDLAYVSEALGYLYHARILCEIGVPDEVIRSVFSRSPHSSRIRTLMEKVGLMDLEPGFRPALEEKRKD